MMNEERKNVYVDEEDVGSFTTLVLRVTRDDLKKNRGNGYTAELLGDSCRGMKIEEVLTPILCNIVNQAENITEEGAVA